MNKPGRQHKSCHWCACPIVSGPNTKKFCCPAHSMRWTSRKIATEKRALLQDRQCLWCDVTFRQRIKLQKFCCPNHSEKWHGRNKNRAKLIFHAERECVWCKVVFTPSRSGQLACCKSHGSRYAYATQEKYRGRSAKFTREQKDIHNAKARAKRLEEKTTNPDRYKEKNTQQRIAQNRSQALRSAITTPTMPRQGTPLVCKNRWCSIPFYPDIKSRRYCTLYCKQQNHWRKRYDDMLPGDKKINNKIQTIRRKRNDDRIKATQLLVSLNGFVDQAKLDLIMKKYVR